MSEISEEDYRKLKREVEDAKAEASRAQGALDQLTARLKEEFDCDSVKEAKDQLVILTAKRENASKAFDKAKRDYEKKWKEE